MEMKIIRYLRTNNLPIFLFPHFCVIIYPFWCIYYFSQDHNICERRQKYINVGRFSPSLRKLRFSGGLFPWFFRHRNYLPWFKDLHKKCNPQVLNVSLVIHYMSIFMDIFYCFLNWLTQSDKRVQPFLYTTFEGSYLKACLNPPHAQSFTGL